MKEQNYLDELSDNFVIFRKKSKRKSKNYPMPEYNTQGLTGFYFESDKSFRERILKLNKI
jgi:hypothetical protein